MLLHYNEWSQFGRRTTVGPTLAVNLHNLILFSYCKLGNLV